VDSDQYGCLASGNHVDPAAIALGRSINAQWNTDLDLWHRWNLHGRDGGTDHRRGMIRLLRFPIEIGDRPLGNSSAPAESVSLRS
jgi:hypothetical protein